MDQIGKYKVIRLLGQGGFGAVYLAEDPKLKEQVAIKVFEVKDDNLARLVTSATSDASEVLQARFLNEAKTLRQLAENPHIVDVYEFGELPEGQPYYVMPYLPRSLKNLLGSDATNPSVIAELPADEKPRPIPLSNALDYLKQLLIALKSVHQAGLVHRDIKPANLLLSDNHSVKLCDFGIAKVPDTDHSHSGVGMGSRNYTAPEQRQSAKHVDARSDIYSVGVLAYRMVTGTLPEGRFKDPATFQPGMTTAFNDLILKALEQQPDKRFADAGDMLRALQKVDADGAEQNDDTGTWIDEGKAEIKAELKPLKARIEKLLSEQGEIRDKDKPGLEALASVIGLEENELTAFVEQTIASFAQTSGTNAGLIKWIEGVNRRTAGTGKTIRNILSQEEYDAFMDVGLSTTGKEKGALEALLKAKGITVKQQGASQPGKKPQEQHQPTTGFSGGKWGIAIAAVLLVGVIGYFIYDSQPTRSSTASKSQQKTVSTPTTTTTEYRLRLTSSPSTASIRINGKRYRSGETATLPKGQYTLTASSTGYETTEKRITLDGHQSEHLTLTKTAPPTYPLTVSTTPSDARVQIMNITPGYYDGIQLEAGEYQLRVSKTGYQTKEQWVSLNNNNRRFSVTLTQDKPKHSAAVQSLLDSMVTIPAGSYMMGSNDGDNDEKPVHRVSIKPFRLMEHEMTWAMYQPCIDAGVCPDNQKEGADEGWGKGNRPMINVSWNDITQKYIPWLNEQTGQTFRLPTEAEWEYAARAGSTSKYSWGNDIGNNRANCDGCGSQWDISKTAPVKSFSPNAFGLYDMHGNIWEWVQDCWNGSYNGAPGNGSAWMQGNCESAVLRGGSWFNSPSYLRSANRFRNDRSSRNDSYGFRLAQDL